MTNILPIGTRVKLLDKTELTSKELSRIYKEHVENGVPAFITGHGGRHNRKAYVVDLRQDSTTGDYFAYTDVEPWSSHLEGVEEL